MTNDNDDQRVRIFTATVSSGADSNTKYKIDVFSKFICVASITALCITVFYQNYLVPAANETEQAIETPKSDTSDAPHYKVNKSTFMVKSQTLVKMHLRDSTGVKWKNLYVSDNFGTRVLCGEINAKNGFGGMTGFQRFLSGGITVLEEEMEPEEFNKAWQQLCAS